MDKAVVGACRVGYFRVGVTVTLFDDAVERLEKIHIEESAYFGIAHFGKARFGEKDSSLFKVAVKAVERQ